MKRDGVYSTSLIYDVRSKSDIDEEWLVCDWSCSKCDFNIAV